MKRLQLKVHSKRELCASFRLSKNINLSLNCHFLKENKKLTEQSHHEVHSVAFLELSVIFKIQFFFTYFSSMLA